ncbi:MAG TPA: hypothetical protein VLW26_01175 [Steroidobacteraceae bacterium]|nr:hypothetical protein [Steroidobacteraceae bacterium]
MIRFLLPIALALALSGCGLGATTAAAPVAGASELQQAHDAKETEERVRQQVEAAQQAEAQRRDAAEAANQ